MSALHADRRLIARSALLDAMAALSAAEKGILNASAALEETDYQQLAGQVRLAGAHLKSQRAILDVLRAQIPAVKP